MAQNPAPLASGRRIVGTNIVLFYEGDEAVRSLIPEPFQVEKPLRVIAWFQEQSVYDDTPLKQRPPVTISGPARYSEVVFKVPIVYEGKPYNFPVAAWTDNQPLVQRGRLLGVPQQPGQVTITSLHPADLVYNAPAAGLTLDLTITVDQQYGRGSLSLAERCDPADMALKTLENITRRTFKDLATGEVILDDISAGWAADYEIADCWRGTAEFETLALPGAELSVLAPRAMLESYYFTSRYSGQKPSRRVIWKADADV
jgi:hypothetical protein